MAEATRQRIVQAAMELFARRGYGATSIEDILHVTQLHRGSFYHLFPSKHELLLAVLETYRHDTRAMFEAVTSGIGDPVARVFCFVGTYRTALLATDFAVGSPVGSLSLEMHEPDPRAQELLAEVLREWVIVVSEALSAASGRMTSRGARKTLAEFLLSVVEGATVLARAHRDIGYFDRCIAQLREHVELVEGEAAEA